MLPEGMVYPRQFRQSGLLSQQVSLGAYRKLDVDDPTLQPPTTHQPSGQAACHLVNRSVPGTEDEL
jgi:hypothetical protein